MKQIIFVPGIKDKYHFGIKDWTTSRIYCPSHTLFSAIVNNYVAAYGQSNIEKLKEIRVSGVFPCLLDENNEPFIKFIPKPLCNLNINKEYLEKNPKKIKKVEFISYGFLKKQNKKSLNEDEFEIIGGKFLITNEEFEEICEKISDNKNVNNTRREQIKNIKIIDYQNEMKTAINRITGLSLEGYLYVSSFIKPLVYYRNKNEIAFKSGFWALIEIPNDIERELHLAIKLIKDTGLGGEISSGAGLFENINIEDFKEELNKSSYLSLSSYIPTEDEWKYNKNWYYQIEKYKGWVFSYVNPKVIKIPKKSIYYITPGSVFDRSVNGEIVELENNCWFNGKPILISIKVIDNDMD